MIKKISINEYDFSNTRGLDKLETKNKSHSELTLWGYEELLTRLEVLNQKLDIVSLSQEPSNGVVFLLCTNYGQEYFAGDCTKELLMGEIQVVTMNFNLRTTQKDT